MKKIAFSQKLSYKTKQEYVYHILREAIMDGSLAPGEKLTISDIAKQLEVSAIPVREALQLLVSEDLVSYNAHMGAIVAPITKESVEETFAIKEGLESIAARYATKNMSSQHIKRLQDILTEMDDLLESQNFDQWGQLNAEFHGMIVDIATMPTLKTMHSKIVDKWDRIHHYFFNEMLNHRHVQSQEEHYQILTAFKAGKSDEAEHLTKTHNQHALKDYMANLERES
ncbi:GntR family transcriptional regulator [Pullulanibacillus camelliae]|uniref:GntR family transcriptional regulator n=1 Tax=Pullulanibacillus camelliae TaxID=1707096 RepID=A0A8J2YJY6_9BACL|nr:GntR family transcriptional regulator [Pullulanibacillus camelliae]GGE49063.1 GntR family transcriptional regulator [Pullulanibacillus camelliae]